MATTRQKGNEWERAAESFLRQKGLKTLDRNFQMRFGEIDLVMLDGNTLVFTEVRFRGNGAYGSGADSVTWSKQSKLISAASRYLQTHARHRDRACRFDVVSIGIKDGRSLINWVRNAFDAA
jgi:putative endonuclease